MSRHSGSAKDSRLLILYGLGVLYYRRLVLTCVYYGSHIIGLAISLFGGVLQSRVRAILRYREVFFLPLYSLFSPLLYLAILCVFVRLHGYLGHVYGSQRVGVGVS